MPTDKERPKRRAAIRPDGSAQGDRLGAAMVVAGLMVLSSTLVSAGALASCDRAESHRVVADAQDAARQTAAGLDHAAAQAEPVADRAARDAKRGVNDLAIAAGVKKMPSAIDSPVTTAIAAARPSGLGSARLASAGWTVGRESSATGE